MTEPVPRHPLKRTLRDTLREAADQIEAQAAEIERLKQSPWRRLLRWWQEIKSTNGDRK